MRIITLKKKSILTMLSITVFIIMISKVSTSFGMQHYYRVDFTTGLVTATKLNVRSGPGTNYPIIATVKKNEYIRVFAGVGTWYIIQTDDDHVGAVSKDYVKAIYPNSTGSSGGQSSGTQTTSGMNSDEQEVFNLINEQRIKNGLTALKIDNGLQKVARIKTEDMVANNYFSHQSPTYGSPFDMMKSFGITYKSAGENIAANSSNSGAVNAWMNSSGHRANILNANFNYTGVGVVSSPKYGKMYVQQFIGK
ncbi:MAG: SH3 domain-containing protein [Romboutsia sp.]|nr:SH3 domain-containing protein [Romboutsia sp.]